jgi:hypothetical protein
LIKLQFEQISIKKTISSINPDLDPVSIFHFWSQKFKFCYIFFSTVIKEISVAINAKLVDATQPFLRFFLLFMVYHYRSKKRTFLEFVDFLKRCVGKRKRKEGGRKRGKESGVGNECVCVLQKGE